MAEAMQLSRGENLARIMTRTAGWLTLVFLVLPIVAIIPLSFNSAAFLSYPLPGVSLRWYRAVFESDAWLRALKNSMIVGVATTIVATSLGTLAAIGLCRLQPRIRNALTGLFMLPMIVPGVVAALALFLFYAPFGFAGSLAGIIVAHTVLGIPFVVITLTAVLANLDGNLMRAAANLGASPFAAYRRVMFPLVAPAMFSSAIFVFVTSFDEFIVTSFLAGPQQYTLPLQMWSGVHDDVTPAILAAATLFIAASALMLVAVEILRRRLDRLRPASGKVGQ